GRSAGEPILNRRLKEPPITPDALAGEVAGASKVQDVCFPHARIRSCLGQGEDLAGQAISHRSRRGRCLWTPFLLCRCHRLSPNPSTRCGRNDAGYCTTNEPETLRPLANQ